MRQEYSVKIEKHKLHEVIKQAAKGKWERSTAQMKTPGQISGVLSLSGCD